MFQRVHATVIPTRCFEDTLITTFIVVYAPRRHLFIFGREGGEVIGDLSNVCIDDLHIRHFRTFTIFPLLVHSIFTRFRRFGVITSLCAKHVGVANRILVCRQFVGKIYCLDSRRHCFVLIPTLGLDLSYSFLRLAFGLVRLFVPNVLGGTFMYRSHAVTAPRNLPRRNVTF